MSILKVTTLAVRWIDAHREPKVRFNARYPYGIDADVSKGAKRTCFRKLEWPAPRCGTWLVACEACGTRVIVTAAGRIDDPRSIKVACKEKPNADQTR